MVKGVGGDHTGGWPVCGLQAARTLQPGANATSAPPLATPLQSGGILWFVVLPTGALVLPGGAQCTMLSGGALSLVPGRDA